MGWYCEALMLLNDHEMSYAPQCMVKRDCAIHVPHSKFESARRGGGKDRALPGPATCRAALDERCVIDWPAEGP